MSTSTVRRHPIRGLLGGLCAGIGATLLLITYAKAPFGEATGWVPLVVLLVVGLLIGLFAPPRGGGAADHVGETPVPPPHSNVTTTEPEAPTPPADAPEATDTPEQPDDSGTGSATT